jgi:hypothetical protein
MPSFTFGVGSRLGAETHSDGRADQVSRPPSSPRPFLVDVNLGKSAL